MISLELENVKELYNYLFERSNSASSSAEIGGMWFRAEMKPFAIARYSRPQDFRGGSALWRLRFAVRGEHEKPKHPGSRLVSLAHFGEQSDNGYYIKSRFMRKVVRIHLEKVSGDLDRFEKDLVLLRMFDDVWIEPKLDLSFML